MTESYLRNITPDSLSGLVFGFEGIKNALVILNGPTGCKFYHSITAETQSLHKEDYDPLNYPEEWFFGQRRVPCTYLDKRDYVYGSEGKLIDAIRFILGRLTPDILAVVNSPGAALIGDDLERIVNEAVRSTSHSAARHIPVITCQSPGYSKDIIDGWKTACRIVIDKLCDCARPGSADFGGVSGSATSGDDSGSAYEPSVNLLGLSIYQKYHAGDIAEIKRLLGLCGIKVNTALLCESSLDEIKKLPEASLNVVIDPDWGLDSAEYLKERFGIPYVASRYGYPVGFKAMEELIRDICRQLSMSADANTDDRDEEYRRSGTESRDGKYCNVGAEHGTPDPGPALTELAKARAEVYPHIARMSSLTGLPKGMHFAVFGSDAVRRGYSSFLTDYLGMVEDDEDPEIVLADGNTIAMMKAEGRKIGGIEIALPTIGYIDVIQKTHLGAAGGMFLIEQILNSFVY